MVRIFASLTAFALAAPFVQAAFREGCASAPWNSTTDYWITKFTEVEDSGDSDQPFAPKYYGTYATVKNKQKRYVVLHCSDEAPPRDVVGENALIVKVPVTSVEALDSFSQEMITVVSVYIIALTKDARDVSYNRQGRRLRGNDQCMRPRSEYARNRCRQYKLPQ